MITIDLQSRTPIYLQLKDRIVELILLGEFQKDEQLPSVRSLARELGINPNTIQKAYQELEGQGIIYSVGGRGNFISAPESLSTVKRQECAKTLRSSVGEAKMAGVPQLEVEQIVAEVYRMEAGND